MKYAIVSLLAIVALVLAMAGCSTTTDKTNDNPPAYVGDDGTGGVYVVMPEEYLEFEVQERSVSSRFPLWSYAHVWAYESGTPANVFGELWLVRGVNQSGAIGGITAGTVVEVAVDLYAGGNTSTSPPSGGDWAVGATSLPVTIVAGVYSPTTITLPAVAPVISGANPADGSTIGTGFQLELAVAPGCAASGTPQTSIAVADNGTSDGIVYPTVMSTTPSFNITGKSDSDVLVVDVTSLDSSGGTSTTSLTYTVDASLGDGGIDVGIQSTL